MRRRIAVLATALAAWSLATPAHPQTIDWQRSFREPDQKEIDRYREMTINAAKMAVHDETAKVKITALVLRMGFVGYPHACGFVTASGARPQGFIYGYSGQARLFDSLKDGQFIEAMGSCGLLPPSPWPAPDEYFWGNLNLNLRY